MGPGAQSFAQFYHQAALTSAASAGVGGDSLGKLCKKKKKNLPAQVRAIL